jgi:hypothetical protein
MTSRQALVTFGRHCRRMADSRPEERLPMEVSLGRVEQVPVGELEPGERALWRRLADEVESYLTDPLQPGPDDVALFTNEVPR